MFANTLTRSSKRRVLLVGITAAAASAGISATAQDAQAAFTLQACQGSLAAAQGASFQTEAQTFWRGIYTSSNGCDGPPAPTYKGNGSGNGLAAMGAGGGGGGANGLICATAATNPCSPNPGLPAGQRDLNSSFSGTDEPPSVAQTNAINAGNPASTSDDGLMHVIPVATGASAVIVNLPSGCNVSGVAAERKTSGANGMVNNADTGDSETTGTSRLRIPNVTIEKAFAGDTDANEWGELAPGLAGTPSSSQNSAFTCATVPVKRIVRLDESGTTYGFKAYLGLINPGRRWLRDYVGPNTRWPAGNGSGTPVAPVQKTATESCANTDANLLCAGPSANATNLSNLVSRTDGSIGYADLATARARGFDITPLAPTGTPPANQQPAQTDDQYWIPLQNKPNGTPDGYVEPTVDPRAHAGTSGSKGAACSTSSISGAPTASNSPRGDATLGDWSNAAAAGGAGYPACVLTYLLAWDDNAPVYGNSPAEEAKARTVKDFLTRSVLSGFGQAFTGQDYSALPAVLLSAAQNGTNAINWNKSADVTQPPPTPPTTTTPPPTTPPPGTPGVTPPPVQTTPTGPTPPPTVRPSNRYSVSSGKVNKAKTTITYTVKVPGRGTLRSVSSYIKRVRSRNRTIKVSTVTSRPTRASTLRVVVRLTKANRADLKRLKLLRIATRFTYTPAGGTAASQRKAANIRRR